MPPRKGWVASATAQSRAEPPTLKLAIFLIESASPITLYNDVYAEKVFRRAKPAKSFEETLWNTANKLRVSVESSEYKHVILSLIFLKFGSDKFEER